MLVTGPASAMSASSRGVRESESMVVAPPKMKRVMPSTFSPKRARDERVRQLMRQRPTRRRGRAVAPATTQYWASDQPRNWRGNWTSASV